MGAFTMRRLFLAGIFLCVFSSGLRGREGAARAADVPGSASGAATELATAAYGILKTHCYSCHGVKQSVPDRHVLLRETLIRVRADEGAWVVPGNLNQSKLWQAVFVNREMPPDDGNSRPSDAELETLREWILAGAELPVLESRTPVGEVETVRRIRDDLTGQPSNSRRFLRYFSLAHLHNNPAVTSQDLDLARAGFVKMVNSVSRSARLVTPVLVDAPAGSPSQGTLFRLDLRDVNWPLVTWQTVLSTYPYGLSARSVELREMQQDIERLWGATQADGIPYVRADWFVFTASRGAAYHALLDLPDTIDALEKQLGVDPVRDFQEDQMQRAGFAGSGVSRHNRLIDRYRATNTRYYYRSYDFGKSAGRGLLYRFPLGPKRDQQPFEDAAFEADGGEVIWSLPNGMQGYLIVDKQGKRIDEAPVQIVRDVRESSGSPIVVNGISCIACHRDGLHFFRDSVRRYSALSGPAQEKVDRLYREATQMESLVADDRRIFLETQQRLLSPYLQRGDQAIRVEDQPEPVSVLTRFYYQDLTLAEVAYELGFDEPKKLPVESNERLRELGLLPLSAGGKIPREMWDSRADSPASLFQESAIALGLGSAVNP
jgi:serine/threonine-protein kinase